MQKVQGHDRVPNIKLTKAKIIQTMNQIKINILNPLNILLIS